MGAQFSTVLPPPTLLLGQMLPVFLYGGARSSTVLPPPTLPLRQIDAARFYTVGCAILHCATPSPTLLLGRILPVFYTVGARSSTVLPPPTLLLGQMLLVFFYTVGGANFYCASPYTAPINRVNATCLGAMSVDVSNGPLLCCPPTLCMG